MELLEYFQVIFPFKIFGICICERQPFPVCGFTCPISVFFPSPLAKVQLADAQIPCVFPTLRAALLYFQMSYTSKWLRRGFGGRLRTSLIGLFKLSW